MCVNCSSYCEFLRWINHQWAAFTYSTHSDHDHLHPNHRCCQLLKSNVWTLLTSLTSMSEPAAASRSTISSAHKLKNRSSLSESLKRSVLKTGNTFLHLDFQKLSHFRFVYKDAEEVAEDSYCYYSQDSCEIVRKYPCMEVTKFTNRNGTFWDILPSSPHGRFRTLHPTKVQWCFWDRPRE